MKNLLDKFRISAALDAGQPIPPALDQRVARSAELRRFAARTAHLDQSLKEAPRPRDVPPGLHAAILRNVRAAARPARPAGARGSLLRWLPAPALAGLALAALWWTLQRPAALTQTRPLGAEAPLAAGLAALEWGDAITRRMPEELLAPLAEELSRIEHDLNRSAELLLASVP
jgi:hypothetical protein